MLKKLIRVTSPTTLEIAKQVKQDLEEKGCKVYLTSVLYRWGKNKTTRHVVWREPDDEDIENRLVPEKVKVA